MNCLATSSRSGTGPAIARARPLKPRMETTKEMRARLRMARNYISALPCEADTIHSFAAGEYPAHERNCLRMASFNRLSRSLLICILAALAGGVVKAQSQFEVSETTIAQTNAALRAGKVTCRQLVEAYLKRTGKLRPLHGIAVIVKDNYDTSDLQTTGGSLALKGFVPSTDAWMVKKIREAGGIVLAKSNMAEWAFSPYVTVSSIAGITRNPYDLERVPAGSSGGTAAAVAASLGEVGLGTDTGNSIRGPSSHNALVGIRPTIGLTSRDGIIPLNFFADVGGPMARSVEDAATVLGVVAGYDPADPVTKMSDGKAETDYRKYLVKNGLKGARIGVF